jgi:hypothetical protein
MLGILADAPLAHFRRVLAKLIEAEQQQAPASGAVPSKETSLA